MGENQAHLPILDGGRGFAALLVLVSHSANAGLLPIVLGAGAGQMGVGFFFVLSGFLMAYNYGGRPFTWAEIIDYAVHRLARIVPLFLLVIIISMIAHDSNLWTFPIHSAREAALHLGFIRGGDILWTIPVEVHFYVLFLVLWRYVAVGRPVRALIAIAVANAVLAAALAAGWYVVPSQLLPFWCHFFLFGSAFGILFVRRPEWIPRLAAGRNWIGWLAIGLFFLSLPGLRRTAAIPLLPNFADPITVGATMFLFVAAVFGLGPLKALAAAPMRWLGRISYGIYILHYPVLMNLKELNAPGVVVFAIVAGTTLALAALSYFCFEAPVRRRLVAWSNSRLAVSRHIPPLSNCRSPRDAEEI
ncbi:acyltransferase [Sulfuriferula sp.]|uniref:acyltransferase family protein n=1 Tax=Sulfuriferula sp. TaxID=2025307 RepID=UPI00272F72DC|nr:acyltransferase [Sulfuriferula sp.]MDP2024898.1 acyltransferase [Sulfuriferula sp.]